MPKNNVTVSRLLKNTQQLPEWLSASGLMLTMLSDSIDTARQLWGAGRRSDARDGGVILAFLLAFFSQTRTRSLRKFSELSKESHPQLAGLIGRNHWITQSSLSTALCGIPESLAEELGAWLLLEITPLDLAGSRLAAMRDTQGEDWHLFDYDPTSLGIRRRALPEGPELPPPERRTKDMAAPGHTGRKRAEIICSRAVLQHAGTGFWLGNWANPGNAKNAEAMSKSITHVKRWCERAGLKPERAIMRFDGGVNGAQICRDTELNFVTRSASYHVLYADDVQAQMAKSKWYEVPDSRSGPRRVAAELGTFDALGGRIVVSRYADAGAGAGTVIGKERFELFVTSLDETAWPAAELVSLYYGRSAQENQFAREDAELDLDRRFCHKIPGFQVVTSVGLLVWNLKTHLGAQLAEVDDKHLPTQQPCALKEVEPPTFETQTDENNPSTFETQADEDKQQDETPLTRVSTINWEALFKRRQMSGWSWNSERQSLQCPNQILLKARSRLRQKGHSPTVIFRAPGGACDNCPFRANCTTSTASKFRREVGIPVPRQRYRPPTRRKAPSWTPPPDEKRGPLSPLGHHLRTAHLRHRASEALANTIIIVALPPPPESRCPKWLATSAARRQNRRKSYAERAESSMLSGPVDIAISTSESVEKLLIQWV